MSIPSIQYTHTDSHFLAVVIHHVDGGDPCDLEVEPQQGQEASVPRYQLVFALVWHQGGHTAPERVFGHLHPTGSEDVEVVRGDGWYGTLGTG